VALLFLIILFVFLSVNLFTSVSCVNSIQNSEYCLVTYCYAVCRLSTRKSEVSMQPAVTVCCWTSMMMFWMTMIPRSVAARLLCSVGRTVNPLPIRTCQVVSVLRHPSTGRVVTPTTSRPLSPRRRPRQRPVPHLQQRQQRRVVYDPMLAVDHARRRRLRGRVSLP